MNARKETTVAEAKEVAEVATKEKKNLSKLVAGELDKLVSGEEHSCQQLFAYWRQLKLMERRAVKK